MLLRILSAELLKIRRKLVWLLVLAGPLGVVGLEALAYALRFDYMIRPADSAKMWSDLLSGIGSLALPALLIGLAIVASMTAGIEHQMNAWKMTLALPVKKRHVFAGKFLLTALLLFVSCVLLALFSLVFGLTLGSSLGLHGSVPIGGLLREAFYPYLAAMPFIALQAWLSVTMHNQAVPLTVGIVGMIVSLFAGSRFPDWVPYKWPALLNQWHEPLYSVGAGVALGLVVFLVGMFEFVRKDVK
ncbi:ABC transporter permease [Cohnella fermenti]|uniref:Permease n=1 Tax=Cohnella fermenti TaxID=2565925 RepID=A0A4S4BGH9_9BACL|nr:ABC transporter permease [Cohnella fermenti]THF73557.1 permease [Cohnella fermenti]